MSVPTLEQPSVQPPKNPSTKKRGRRRSGGAFSIMAHGEPTVWLNGAGLVICLAMVVGLLLLVLYQGVTTFWPMPLVQVETLNGDTVMGEITRSEVFDVKFETIAQLSGAEREEASKLLYEAFDSRFGSVSGERFGSELADIDSEARVALMKRVADMPAMKGATDEQRRDFAAWLETQLETHAEAFPGKLSNFIEQKITSDNAVETLQAARAELSGDTSMFLAQANLVDAKASLADDDRLWRLWGDSALTLVATQVEIPMRRRLFRTGNYELTNEHFRWVSDFEVAADSEKEPEWAVLLERMAWGRFYGTPKSITIDGETTVAEPDEVWKLFEQHHASVVERLHERKQLETAETGEINRELESARLELRSVELKHGKDSDAWKAANSEFEQRKAELDAEFAVIREQIDALDAINAKYSMALTTATGVDQPILLADIVRAYPPNRISLTEKTGVYFSRWSEFLLEAPREANSEGGVFPAIWGTVVMTMLMSMAVVPFGVLAALYLREYAKGGWLVSVVRIAVNNLAGVPSIVFGVFGLGFFCYIFGTSIDQLFFSSKLPSPTFGTGGLLWASLTLALLTLPVVIVATEEALAAVPRSMREGSLACGASKWQTIQRIVLPRAMPGIMTGTILAMARGAGEVAPLMLVGAVKLAPELPLNTEFPFVHMQRSFMHLGFHIYDLGFQSQNSEAAKPMVFTTTLLLISLIALMNLIAIWLRARLRRKFNVGH